MKYYTDAELAELKRLDAELHQLWVDRHTTRNRREQASGISQQIAEIHKRVNLRNRTPATDKAMSQLAKRLGIV